MNYCRDIRRCPASHYLSCAAYGNDGNCWEFADKPCCKRQKLDRCGECWVYLEFAKADGSPEPAESAGETA